MFKNLLKNKFSRAKISNAQPWIWLAFATLLTGFFLILSSEVRESLQGQKEFINSLDHVVLDKMGSLRTTTLNAIAIEITALGSGSVLLILVSFTSIFLLLRRQFGQALHLVLVTVGSAALSLLTKLFFQRPRPDKILQIVEYPGFSYPSGHSLSGSAIYLTLAVLFFVHAKKKSERVLVTITSLILISLITISRIYLGVHYLSDVVAGVLLGIGWASVLCAGSALIHSKTTHIENY